MKMSALECSHINFPLENEVDLILEGQFKS